MATHEVRNLTLHARKDILFRFTCAKCNKESGWQSGIIEISKSARTLPMAHTIILTGLGIEKRLLKKVERCKRFDERGKVKEIDFKAVIQDGATKRVGRVICPSCRQKQRYFSNRTSTLLISLFLFLVSTLLNIGLWTNNLPFDSYDKSNESLFMFLFMMLFISFVATVIWFIRNAIGNISAIGVPKIRHKVSFDWLPGKEVYGKYSYEGKPGNIID